LPKALFAIEEEKKSNPKFVAFLEVRGTFTLKFVYWSIDEMLESLPIRARSADAFL
jgi:hypothetical protein